MTKEEMTAHENEMLSGAHPEKCSCVKCQEYWDDYLAWWNKYKETEYETLDLSPKSN